MNLLISSAPRDAGRCRAASCGVLPCPLVDPGSRVAQQQPTAIDVLWINNFRTHQRT